MANWKIERAKHHIRDVEVIVKWIIDPSNYGITSERDPQSGFYRARIGPKVGAIPHELPICIGDALHNLAASLDYLWSGLARVATPQSTTREHFPRHEKRENLADAVSKSPVNQTFPQVYGLIVDQIKPYKDGNFPVWVVGRLDNVDKHRLLVATMAITKLGKFVATAEDGSIVDLSYSTIKTHGPELTLGFIAPFKLNDDAELTADVIFNEVDLPPGQPVLETLVNYTEAVAEVAQAFNEAFL